LGQGANPRLVERLQRGACPRATARALAILGQRYRGATEFAVGSDTRGCDSRLRLMRLLLLLRRWLLLLLRRWLLLLLLRWLLLWWWLLLRLLRVLCGLLLGLLWLLLLLLLLLLLGWVWGFLLSLLLLVGLLWGRPVLLTSPHVSRGGYHRLGFRRRGSTCILCCGITCSPRRGWL